MREFTVTLRCGLRYTVKADRVVYNQQCLTLLLDPDPKSAEPETVALFDWAQVSVVVARDHLISEEKGDPIHVPHLVDSRDSIPF
jgi:hypothetical protein